MIDDGIDCSAMFNYNPDDPQSVLEMQLFISRNHQRMAKLTQSGRAKIEEAYIDRNETIFRGYCKLYQRFCYATNTNPEIIINHCSKNIACGDKSYFKLLI